MVNSSSFIRGRDPSDCFCSDRKQQWRASTGHRLKAVFPNSLLGKQRRGLVLGKSVDSLLCGAG